MELLRKEGDWEEYRDTGVGRRVYVNALSGERTYEVPSIFRNNNDVMDLMGSKEDEDNTGGALTSANKGYKLLLKMGWKEASGLGKNENGRVEPVSVSLVSVLGETMGLGSSSLGVKDLDRQEITKDRKLLKTELIATENAEESRVREERAKREALIQQDVKAILQTLFCDVCNKGYTKVREYENHLSSYDHHHTKRLYEMQIAARNKKAEHAKQEGGKTAAQRAKEELDAVMQQAAGVTPDTSAPAGNLAIVS